MADDGLQLRSNDAEPLYRQLEKYFRSAIVSGELQPGDKIETEEELSERFKVSRITVRNAISILADDGLLIKQQGKGTFVSKPKVSRDIIHVVNFTLNSEINGRRPGCNTVSIKEVAATAADIEIFETAKDGKMIEIVRVRYMDDDPIVIELDYFDSRFSKILKKKTMNESLYAYLRSEFNLDPTTASKTLEMTVASKEEAHLLDVTNGSPLFLMKGIVNDQYGEPLHRSVQKIVGHKYKFLIEND